MIEFSKKLQKKPLRVTQVLFLAFVIWFAATFLIYPLWRVVIQTFF
ncbi:hypothetical protein HMPREF3187_00783, partial [Aerococcus christensenii]